MKCFGTTPRANFYCLAARVLLYAPLHTIVHLRWLKTQWCIGCCYMLHNSEQVQWVVGSIPHSGPMELFLVPASAYTYVGDHLAQRHIAICCTHFRNVYTISNLLMPVVNQFPITPQLLLITVIKRKCSPAICDYRFMIEKL